MQDYREKVRKLFALAGSDNVYEAEAALLQARKLMAKYKIMESEVTGGSKKEVKEILTGLTCSKRRDSWIMELAMVLAPNYCCDAYMSSKYRKQTVEVGIIGFAEDAELCVGILKYAVDCVRSQQEVLKRELKRGDYTTAMITIAMNDYGSGFAEGVAAAFEKQNEENSEEGWGLVLSVPKEVTEVTQSWRTRSIVSEYYEDEEMYELGINDGKDFDPKRRLK